VGCVGEEDWRSRRRSSGGILTKLVSSCGRDVSESGGGELCSNWSLVGE
jgi:hypothetical protein